MRIIYVHHAERAIGPNHHDPLLKQEEDITENGIKEATLVSERFKGNPQNVKAIYTSPYKRCRHTAEILNQYLNVPIIDEERFNEFQNNEKYPALLKRNMSAIDDIVKKYDNDDSIICITSGVNLAAFICYFYNIRPTKKTPWAQAFNMTPINFKVSKKPGKHDLD